MRLTALFLTLLIPAIAFSFEKEQCDMDGLNCTIVINSECRGSPDLCDTKVTKDGDVVWALKGTLPDSSNGQVTDTTLKSVAPADPDAPFVKQQGRLGETAPAPEVEKAVSPFTATKSARLTAEQSEQMSQCQDAADQALNSCSESRSGMNSWRNQLDRESSRLSAYASQGPQACTSMSQFSAGISSAMALWKQGCQSALQKCSQSCDAIRSSLKAIGATSDITLMDQAKASCTQQIKSIRSVENNVQEAQNAAVANVRCQQDAANQQQLANQGLPGFQPPGGSSGAIGSGFRPPNSGASTVPSTGYGGYEGGGRDERATGAGGPEGSTLSGLGADVPTTPSTYEKSKIGQLQIGGAGGGVNGKVVYSGSGPQNNAGKQQRGSGGSAPSPAVNAGFYGVGASAPGSSFKQAAVAPVGGFQNRPSGIGGVAGRGKPDLRKYLPAGGPKRVAASPAQVARFEKPTGRDGLTGPRSNLFRKVSTRYSIHSATLIP